MSSERDPGNLFGEEDAAYFDPFEEDEELRKRNLHLTCMKDVVAVEVEWLWPGWIPKGKLTVIDGDPGLGKSTLTLDLASRVTRGAAMPGEDKQSRPAGVLLIGCEDGLEDTIKPRLDAASADMSRVFALSETDDGQGKTRLLDLRCDLAPIEATILEKDVALVVIDPFVAFLSSKTDSHKDADVRRVLGPLGNMADRTGVAILLVRHLNKKEGGSAIYRGGGSIGITGACRSAILIARSKNDASQCVMARVKGNLAAPPPSQLYELVTSDSGVAVVEWLGDSHETAEELVQVSTSKKASKLDEAKAFLVSALEGKKLKQTDVETLAAQEGINASGALRRASDALGVAKTKGPTCWFWSLPLPRSSEAIGETAQLAHDAHLGGDDNDGER